MTDLRPVEDLVAECKERVAASQGRLADYTKYRNAYDGIRAETRSRRDVVGSTADGRPVLREMRRIYEQEYGPRRGAPNLVRPVVREFTALRGQWPDISVLPEGPDESSQQQADKRTRILDWQYNLSRIRTRQPQAAFALTTMGDACYLLEPMLPEHVEHSGGAFAAPGVYVTPISPEVAFPRFKTGPLAGELHDLFVVSTIDPKEARDRYAVDLRKPGERIHYLGDDQTQVILIGDGQVPRRVAGGPHQLGFCPAEWVFNDPATMHHAQSDLVLAVEINEEVQKLHYMYVDALLWAVWPIVEVNNPHRVTGQVQIGPGAKIETLEGGRVTLHAPQANLAAAQAVMERSSDNLLHMTGMSPIRIEGQIDRSNVTARAVDRQQAPMENRLNLHNAVMGEAIQRVSAKVMLMLHRIPELRDAQMTMYGTQGSRAYAEAFGGADMGGWYHTAVRFDPLLGIGYHERVAIALQLRQAGLYTDRKVLEIAGEDDPDAMLAQVAQDQVRHAREQAAAQAQAAPQSPPQGDTAPQGGGGADMPAPGAPPPATAVQPPPGNPVAPTPGPAASPLPGFPPVDSSPAGSGRGTPAPVPDVSAMVQQALDSVPWLSTEQPPAEWALTPQGVQVVVSDHRDTGQVRRILRPVVAMLYGDPDKLHVRAMSPNGRHR